MGLISDVTSFEVDQVGEVSIVSNMTVIDIDDAFAIPNIDLQEDAGPEFIEIQTEGPPGPPGLQNVYPQSTNPAVQYGWGLEETGFIWLQT